MLAATLNAMALWNLEREEGVNVYEERELIVL
jgi:hypothetical protein